MSGGSFWEPKETVDVYLILPTGTRHTNPGLSTSRFLTKREIIFYPISANTFSHCLNILYSATSLSPRSIHRGLLSARQCAKSLNTSSYFKLIPSQIPCEVAAIISSILQMKKLRPIKMNLLQRLCL